MGDIFLARHADWRGDPEFDQVLSEIRLVVVNAEGTIHHALPAGWVANGSDMVALLADFDLVAAHDSRSAEQMGTGGAVVPRSFYDANIENGHGVARRY